jgi:hypothetical protein
MGAIFDQYFQLNKHWGHFHIEATEKWEHLKGYYYPHDIGAQILVGEFVGEPLVALYP